MKIFIFGNIYIGNIYNKRRFTQVESSAFASDNEILRAPEGYDNQKKEKTLRIIEIS